jgi:hypothetical protein
MTAPLSSDERIHAKLDKVLVILEGHHDEDGTHFPGLSHRVKRLENALNWAIGIGTSAMASVFAYWAVILGGKHP